MSSASPEGGKRGLREQIADALTAGDDQLSLYPSSGEDAEYLYELLETTMRGYFEQSGGLWDCASVRRVVVEAAAAGWFWFIEINDHRVGAIRIDVHDSHVQLEQFYLEPSRQRQGIGTRLLGRLTGWCQSQAKPLRLRVLKANPARTLYARLGFQITGQSELQYFMEYLQIGDEP